MCTTIKSSSSSTGVYHSLGVNLILITLTAVAYMVLFKRSSYFRPERWYALHSVSQLTEKKQSLSTRLVATAVVPMILWTLRYGITAQQ